MAKKSNIFMSGPGEYITPSWSWYFSTAPTSIVMSFSVASKVNKKALEREFQGFALSVKKTKSGNRYCYYHNGKRITAKEAKEWGIKVVRRHGEKYFQMTGKTI